MILKSDLTELRGRFDSAMKGGKSTLKPEKDWRIAVQRETMMPSG